MQFQIGDYVTAFGLYGYIMGTEPDLYDPDIKHWYVIYVDGAGSDYFTLDGKMSEFHKEPSLFFVNRPKKEVKKTLECYVNLYPDTTSPTGLFPVAFCSEDDANNYARTCKYVCVKVTGEYTVIE